MQYARIHADDSGETHIDDIHIETTPLEYAPPAKPFDVSRPLGAGAAVFASMEPGWYGTPHASPRRQFWIQLSGEVEWGSSDGSKCRTVPGDVLLLDDTTGKGHETRVVSDEAAEGLFVHLEE